MIDQQTDPQVIRERWITDRIAEFQADPAARDRAIATICYDFEQVTHYVGEMVTMIRTEGLGGLLKAAMGAMRNGR